MIIGAAVGCSGSEPETAVTSRTALEGTYYSATSDVFRWIEFDDDRFVSVAPGADCESDEPADTCIHRGTFSRTADDELTLDDETTNTRTTFQLDVRPVDLDGALTTKSLVSGETELVDKQSNLVAKAAQFTLVKKTQQKVVKAAEKPIVVAGRLATYYALCVLSVGQVVLGVPNADVPDPLPNPPKLVTSNKCRK